MDVSYDGVDVNGNSSGNDAYIDIENQENNENPTEETSNTEIKSESVEIFSESEKNDIEQIIDILE